jgi:hypothetical protein
MYHMQQSTATARRLREQTDLSRELSGLDVKICPNCSRGIDAEALEREKESHQCRLCVRPVPIAGEDEAAPLEAAAKDCDRRAAELKARIAEVNRELAAQHTETDLDEAIFVRHFRTPLELFMAGVRAREADPRRRLNDGKNVEHVA